MRVVDIQYNEELPRYKEAYLANYGWHFTHRACEIACQGIRKKNPATERIEPVEILTKDQVDDMLKMHGITLENNTMYDYVFVANMAKSDFYKSSLPDDAHLALFVKDYVDDPDAGDGFIMRRWYATMISKGEPIDWEFML